MMFSAKEVEVPPHIISIFNQAFEENISGCRLVIPFEDKLTDAEIWSALVQARSTQVFSGSDDTEEDLEDDEVFLRNRKKIIWH